MRLLQIIPILHTDRDLGQLAEKARQVTSASQGPDAWTQKQQVINDLWSQIASFVHQLPANLNNYRVYQDGLPICDQEERIVADLAAQGNLNHQLLQTLRSRGAHIMGTESPQLLLEEYLLARGAPRSPETAAQLLQRRDAFIAARIDATLQAHESGLLFIGMLHRVETQLPADIQVSYPCRNSGG